MIKLNSVFFIVLLILIAMNSCRKDKYVKPVCFDTDVQPILVSKCTMSGCHNSITKPGGLDLTSYSAFQNYSSKDKILKYIKDGTMPKTGSLTVQEKEMLIRWAERNYEKGNCSSSSLNCDTTQTITYTNSVKQIFDTYCALSGCHTSMSMSGGYALDTYTGCVNCANSGRLMGAIQWLAGYSAMPKGGSKLSDCDIAKIQKWINSGKPN